ncbi:efflux RND transporter periplasmic adaptor subunit [Microvirga lotononidis]|uniref:RND family efflux transporter, MFP subunit n=1 Tax=Microvirga lotononidis TaxID=864069 RepID=I4Z1Z4_9HYPH|nr:efflux RND transporter periplasmic adaptor subunit [Microvirga lotononidis]EIM30236.1 RND family efflux transporter, MFP subunit [Microvirga lotononidis]WQO31546.1 efflux RND transporter periplasmic adaptor subunit [Microvirga lotononidis]
MAALAIGGPALAQAPLPAVGVMPVLIEDASPSSEFVGRVEAVNAVDIRARVEGFIEARPFAEGQEVREWQELFILEDGAYEAALSAARASLAGAQAALRDAEGRLQRNQELRRTQAVSQAALEEIQAARDTAQANVMAAEASVRRADLNLGYTTIRAPIVGRIGAAAFAVGSFVGPASGALARVVQVDPIRVVFSVSDRAILDFRSAAGDASKEELAKGFIPTLRLSNGRDYPGKGEIEFAGNEIDPTTGTLPVRARFPNPDALLVPGQFVTVVVRPSDPRRRPVVPVGAVQLDREGRFVLILEEGDKVALRRIRTGPQIGQNWTVEDGLQGGERLIVQGFRNARPGAQVSVIPAQGIVPGPSTGAAVR